MSEQEDIKRYFANRQKEIDGAALYNVMAEKESQPQMAEFIASWRRAKRNTLQPGKRNSKNSK